jgi:hypothetical protein
MEFGERWASTAAWPGPAEGLPAAPARAAYSRAMCEAYYLQRTRLRYRETEAAPAPIGRGRERRDQRAGRAQSIGEDVPTAEERLKSTQKRCSFRSIALGAVAPFRTLLVTSRAGRLAPTACVRSASVAISEGAVSR